MGRHMILYRGSLKSCNYCCSYCPFSKRRMSERELWRDREQWRSFLTAFEKSAKALDIHALMVVPYGEALIHSWYWEGLARISALPEMDGVGAQTNLSFPVLESLAGFAGAGGNTEKLRLWATFHPQMTTVSEFAGKCRQLREAGVMLCAGAVGVPDNLELLGRLRRELPEEIYLWVNRMDGLERPYTPEEEKAFLEIDPYFLRELVPVPADVTGCRGRLFVEGNGRLHTCNISLGLEMSWEELCEKAAASSHTSSAEEPGRETDYFPAPVCGQKRCSCFLAYGGREDFVNHMLFGPYPLFRIPRRPGAVFLDIAGTLLSGAAGGGAGFAGILAGLEALSREKAYLFFATTLPYEEAMRRCVGIRHLFSGGIFAGGAHLILEKDGKRREHFYYLDEECVAGLKPLERKYSFRILVCRNEGRVYKVTLFRSGHRPWSGQEAEEVFSALPDSGREASRYFIEENCMQIVSARADKASGVKRLCQWLSVSRHEIFAFGDSEEDAEMMRLSFMNSSLPYL